MKVEILKKRGESHGLLKGILKAEIIHTQDEKKGVIHETRKDAQNLTAILNSDNSVDFLDSEGKICYHIDIPYMMDANFAVLNQIETSVTAKGNQWIITYTPDADWFTSEERVYPILLDPAITTGEYNANIEDTYVEQGSSTVHTSEQLLYINGGTGARKVVVRVNHLPQINDSLPIISADIALTTTATPLAGADITLKLDYITGNQAQSLASYTYEMASATPAFSTGMILSNGMTVASFDLTDYIYEILKDGGDFVLDYDPTAERGYCYPFYSSEATSAELRPTMSVTYGYSLPEGMQNGMTYSFQSSSGLYLTVPGINSAIGTNVYQMPQDATGYIGDFDFQLVYNSETGGYKLHPTYNYADASIVLEVDKSTNAGSDWYNVCLGNGDDVENQEWLIIPADDTSFYIVLRSDMSFRLTAYGASAGTSSGTSKTSEGNIFVSSEASDSSYHQTWYIYNGSNDQVFPDYGVSLPTGVYYFINRYSGRYLYRDRGSLIGSRGIITAQESKDNASDENISQYYLYAPHIQWQITDLRNGYCTIKTLSDEYYLCADIDESGGALKIRAMNDESIPDKFQWQLTIVTGGGVTLRNKVTGTDADGNEIYYSLTDTGDLYASQSSNALNKSGSLGTETYEKQVWLIWSTERYVEWDTEYGFDSIILEVGKKANISVNHTASCSNIRDDFILSIETGADFFTLSNTNDSIIANKTGLACINAYHKVTGIQDTIQIGIIENVFFKSQRLPGRNADNTAIAPDMITNDKSKEELEQMHSILVEVADKYDASPRDVFDMMLNNLVTITDSGMKDVYMEMVHKFYVGSGGMYSNPTLTDRVYNHRNTQKFISEINAIIDQHIKESPQRFPDNETFINEINGVSRPAYNDEADLVNGLTICLNDTWGYYLTVTEFYTTETSYSIKIKFYIYDHFGLDDPDISGDNENRLLISLFPAWYVLQHYTGCNNAHQPFITEIVFEKSFSGTIT